MTVSRSFRQHIERGAQPVVAALHSLFQTDVISKALRIKPKFSPLGVFRALQYQRIHLIPRMIGLGRLEVERGDRHHEADRIDTLDAQRSIFGFVRAQQQRGWSFSNHFDADILLMGLMRRMRRITPTFQ